MSTSNPSSDTALEAGLVYVVVTYDGFGRPTSDVEILSSAPQWFDPTGEHYDPISRRQVVYAGYVNGGDTLRWDWRNP